MSGLLGTQTCPHCGDEVEDCYAEWGYESETVVKCDSCSKEYTVRPQYEFIGFQIDFKCSICGDETMDGMKLCYCGETEE